jgi:hypothetical protein
LSQERSEPDEEEQHDYSAKQANEHEAAISPADAVPDNKHGKEDNRYE